jgi:hypothetical protein
MNSPKWTYTSDSCGYMLFKDGVAQSGARTLGTATHTSDGRRRHHKHRAADAAIYRATAHRLCAIENANLGAEVEVPKELA